MVKTLHALQSWNDLDGVAIGLEVKVEICWWEKNARCSKRIGDFQTDPLLP